ncbi:MAG: DMT family transporter [Pseudomonadota bacterium]|nr:DMT family transporter [Pseudomonadota bacterium]
MNDPGSSRRVAGALTICAAVAIASSLDAMVKWLSAGYPVHELLVIRGLVALPLLFGVVCYENLLGSLRPRRLELVIVRGLLLASANLAFSLATAAIAIADTVAIYFTMPFFVAAVAAPFLGERVRWYRWLAILAGFAGVIIMIRPGAGVFEPAALFALYAAFGYGVGQAMARPLAHINASVIAFHQNTIFLLVAAALSLTFGAGQFAVPAHQSLRFLMSAWIWPGQADLLLMTGIGVMAAVAMPMFAQAYRIADASFIAPFEYTAMFWAVVWGAVLFGDFPDGWTWSGAAVVITAGLFMLHMDNVYQRRRAPSHGIA